jgi:nucleoid DNA-binding protein
VKVKDVKGAIEVYVGLVATQVKKTEAFKLGGALNFKLNKKPSTAARKAVNPFTKEPCVFKAKPASKTVKEYAMKKRKDMIN